MLTEKLVLGMNTLSFAGFVTIAGSLALTRRGSLRLGQQRMRARIAVALMIGGTVLVAFGIYLAPPLFP